jgi:ribosomal protein L29
MKKEQKKEIRALSYKEMMDKLQELNLEKMKIEVYLRAGGHLTNRLALDKAKSSVGNKNKDIPGTLRNIKKMIAFIKQEMHMKYLRGEMNGKR